MTARVDTESSDDERAGARAAEQRETAAGAANERTPFARRLIRAAALHADTYEEIEADRAALWQAFLVVALASAAAALGLYLRHRGGVTIGSLPFEWMLGLVAIEPFITWIAGSAFAYMVGSSFFRGPETETDYLELLRTTGFAFGPLWLAVFAFVEPPILALALGLTSRLWMWAACIVAVRQALDFTTLRAIGTFGSAALLLWLVIWGLSVMPLPA